MATLHSLDRIALTSEQYDDIILQMRTHHFEEVKRLNDKIQSDQETIRKDREMFTAERFRLTREISELQKLYIAAESENNSRRSAAIKRTRK